MIVKSANDNQRETMIRFTPFLTDASNLTIPREAINLQGLLNVLKSMKGRDNDLER